MGIKAENKTAVTQLFDIIKGVAQYSEDNPLLNQILMSEKRLLEVEKEQMTEAYRSGVADEREDTEEVMTLRLHGKYYAETYGGDNG